jgi:hypothetical protein
MATAPKTAGSHDGIHSALIAALTAMGPVKKDANNPAYKSKYASLESVLETIEGPLHAAGLVFTQTFDVVGGEVLLVTTLTHAETEQAIVSKAPVRCQEPNNPQKLGGAITYMRRYSLLALLGLAPEDDDGALASQPAKAPRQAPRQNVAPDLGPPNQGALDPTEVIGEYHRRLVGAPDKQALIAVGKEMAAAGIDDAGLTEVFRRRKTAFQAAE